MTKIKYILFIIISLSLIFMSNYSSAQPSWVWAKGISQSGNHGLSSTGVDTDANGNIYVAGRAGVGAVINGTALQKSNMFLVKFDSQGNFIWVRKSNSVLWPHDMHTDAAGNTYITGQYYDSLLIGTYSIPCRGRYDIFTVKYDSGGNLLWAKASGSPGPPPGYPSMPPHIEDEATAISVDEAGNCYIGGYVMTSPGRHASFDTIAVHHNPANQGVWYENVIAKYNAAGDIEWVRKMPFSPSRMAANNRGCYFIGTFGGNAVFDSLTTLSTNGQEDIGYGRFDAAGNLDWARNIGGLDGDDGDDIAVNPKGEIYLTGSFKGHMIAGTDTLTSANVSLFLIKTDSVGNVLQAGQTRGAGLAGDASLAIDTFGNSYVSCNANNNIVVGNQTFNAGVHSNLLVVKFDSTSQPVWADLGSGGGLILNYGIALSSNYQECYVTGTFPGSITFGSHSVSNSSNNSTLFLAKLDHILTTGTSSFITEQNYAVYPNPASKNLHLELPEGILTAKVEITDLSGRLILKSNFTADTKMLDIAAVPSGMYVLRITTSAGSVAKKLRVEN